MWTLALALDSAISKRREQNLWDLPQEYEALVESRDALKDDLWMRLAKRTLRVSLVKLDSVNENDSELSLLLSLRVSSYSLSLYHPSYRNQIACMPFSDDSYKDVGFYDGTSDVFRMRSENLMVIVSLHAREPSHM